MKEEERWGGESNSNSKQFEVNIERSATLFKESSPKKVLSVVFF
jgi:hypothetical protein